MYSTRRMLTAATAAALIGSGGAYVAAQQIGQAPAQPPAQAQADGEEDLEQFEGRIVDVVQFVRGEDGPAQGPAQFGAPPMPEQQGQDEPGGGIGVPAPPPDDAPDQPAQPRQQQPGQPGAAPPPQRPAGPPPGIGGLGSDGPVGLVKQEGNDHEQLVILGVEDTPAGPPPGAMPPGQPPGQPQGQAPAGEAPAPLPAPQQDAPEQPQQQDPPEIDIPGGGLGQPAPPPQQPQGEQPEQAPAPAPAPPPGAGVGGPAEPGAVRSQADLDRHVGDEVTIHGERHERAGVEVIVVHRIERDAPEAPAQFGQPGQAQPPAQVPDEPADAPAPQQDGDDDNGFDFDW